MQSPRRVALGAILGLAIGGLLTGVGALHQPGYAAGMPGKGVTVRPVQGTDLESRFQMEVVSIGLERLGYEVEEMKLMLGPPAYLAIAQGDLDFYAENWEPQHDAFIQAAGGDDKLTTLGVLISGAGQGYLIDKRTAEEFGITNIEQLKDPEIAKLFDSDGDGKANLAGCPPGWGCELIIEHQMDAYGLRDTVTHDSGDWVPIHADAVARYRAGERILYYTYTPLWLNRLLVPGEDVEWLEVPEVAIPAKLMKEGVSTSLPDGRNVGWYVINIRITANNDFLAKNPAAKRFFELVNIPLPDVDTQNYLIYEGEKSFPDVRRHAEEWVAKNEEQFNAWVEEAAKAAQ